MFVFGCLCFCWLISSGTPESICLMHNDAVIMHLLDVKYCSMSLTDTHPIRNYLQPQVIPVPTKLHQRFWISHFKIGFQPHTSPGPSSTPPGSSSASRMCSPNRGGRAKPEKSSIIWKRETILCFHNNLFKQQFMHTQNTEAET